MLDVLMTFSVMAYLAVAGGTYVGFGEDNPLPIMGLIVALFWPLLVCIRIGIIIGSPAR